MLDTTAPDDDRARPGFRAFMALVEASHELRMTPDEEIETEGDRLVIQLETMRAALLRRMGGSHGR